MPNRIIRESAVTSQTLDQLSDGAERTFWRLTVVADDQGRFDADPRVLLARCYPLRVGRWKPERLREHLGELVRAGLVQCYEIAPRVYGLFVTWARHQRVRDSRSKFPDPAAGTLVVAADCGDSPRVAADGGSRARAPRAENREPRAESREPRIEKDAADGGESPPSWPSPEALLGLYNAEAADELPEATVLSPERRRRAAALLKAFPDRDWWLETFRSTRASRFLRGLAAPRNGHKAFRPSFDWFLGRGQDGVENALKVYEGRYTD